MHKEKLKYVLFHQWRLKTIFGGSIFLVSPNAKKLEGPELLLDILPIYQLNPVVTLKKEYLQRNILPDEVFR